MPSPADAASNMPVHLLSRSRINIVNSSSAVAEAQQARNLLMTPVTRGRVRACDSRSRGVGDGGLIVIL